MAFTTAHRVDTFPLCYLFGGILGCNLFFGFYWQGSDYLAGLRETANQQTGYHTSTENNFHFVHDTSVLDLGCLLSSGDTLLSIVKHRERVLVLYKQQYPLCLLIKIYVNSLYA